ncbi:MAG: 5'/3'-nucleotidase SurE [Chlamydiia bacterium]|nr:5'/3'-nucleotidase SurE [Chlamydiia bacterium]
MKKRLKILLTNDDGINAPGLHHLYEALREADFADLVIAAPATEKSGAGVSITWDRPIQLKKISWNKNTPAWSIDGSPADCVKMGIRVIFDFIPDMIVSGVNAGSNAGRNVLHSGTVGAVIEGVLRGIPGIAFSCEDGKAPNFHVARKYIATLVNYLLNHPLESGCFLNVNFPHAAQDLVKGFKLTRQGKGRWSEDPQLHLHTEHGPTYWLGGKPEELDEEGDCDISYLREGYLTAVPIHAHELTCLRELENRKEEFEAFLLKKNGKISI